jgi:transposase-like protein
MIMICYLRMMISNIQKTYYLLHRGQKCPFCKNDKLEKKNVDISDYFAYQNITCLDCEKEWCDVYKLTDVFEL